MSIWDRDGDDGEEDNENDEEEEFKSSVDRIMFLIDARAPMLSQNSKGETQIQNCLSVALEVMKTKVVAQDASSIGLTFYGTRNKDSPESADNIFSLFPLSAPSAQNIRLIQNLVEDLGEFERTIGSQSSLTPFCPLKQAFWACSQSFGTKDLKKTDFKRVWLFTNDDNPNGDYEIEQKATVTVARDCAQAGIEISLWHLNRPHMVFDPKRFFYNLLTMTVPGASSTASQPQDEDEDDNGIDQRMLGGGFDGFDSLMASVRRKQYRKRRMGQLLFALSDAPLINGDGESCKPHMCVKMFKMVQIVKRPLHTWLSARSNEPAKSVSRYLDAATGEILEPEGIETYIDVQGHGVPITTAEMLSLKQRDPWHNFAPLQINKKDPLACNIPGVRLLFCIPQDALPLHLNLMTPYFLYPGDQSIKGSAVLFEALLRDLLQKKRVAIVRFTRNLSAGKPTLAVLLPQREVLEEEVEAGVAGVQLVPPGFQCVPLPCIEDLRFNPQPQNTLIEDDASLLATGRVGQAVQDYVSAMTLDGSESDFDYTRDIENPALQAFYATLQAVALGEERLCWDRATMDSMMPKEEHLQAANSALSLITRSLGLDGGEEEEGDAKPATARGRKPAAASAGRKRTKKEADDEEEIDEVAVKSKRKAAAPKVKKEEDSDADSIARGPKRRAPARAKREAVIDEDDGDDGEEEAPKKKPRAAAVRQVTADSQGRVLESSATTKKRGRGAKALLNNDDSDFEF